MADEVVLPVAGAEPAPVAVEPVAAAPAEGAAAVVEAAPTAEALVEPVTEAPVEPVVDAEPAGGDPTKAADGKDPKVVEPAKPAEPVVETAPAEPIAYADFTIPEGLVVEPKQIESFHGVLNKFGLNQEAGQELMDLHAATLKDAVTATEQRNADRFAEMRSDWVKQVDKQYGNKRDTVINDAKWAIETLIPDKKQREAVWGAMSLTGAGDHPAMVGLMAAVAKKLRERNAPSATLPTRPSANKADQRYGAEPRR
jgi:hypothetical protein